MVRCENCAYWVRDEHKAPGGLVKKDGSPKVRQGECVRFPPHPIHGRPLTMSYELCGEGKEKEG